MEGLQGTWAQPALCCLAGGLAPLELPLSCQASRHGTRAPSWSWRLLSQLFHAPKGWHLLAAARGSRGNSSSCLGHLLWDRLGAAGLGSGPSLWHLGWWLGMEAASRTVGQTP